MRRQTVLRVFVASPGDVSDERRAVVDIGEEINLIWSDFIGTRLDVVRWETHATPAIGLDGQDVINEQIGDTYDLLLGILWSRLGTPTPRFLSGTVEEIQSAIETHKSQERPVQIMIYLKTMPAPGANPDELGRLNSFIRELQNQGLLIWRFQTTEHFRQALRIHLSRFIQRSASSARAAGRPPVSLPTKESEAAPLILAAQHLQACALAADASTQHARDIGALLSIHAQEMNEATVALRRLLRPGFRKPPGGWKPITDRFASHLKDFAVQLSSATLALFGAYGSCVTELGKGLAIVAPLSPLPAASSVHLTSLLSRVATMRAELAKVRTAETEFREVIAGWSRLDPSFNAAKRSALEAIDQFDVEATQALQLTRELERTIEVFLEA